MRLCVVSTIAQHKLGANFHLKNLSWALQDHDITILLQTYKSYGLKFQDPRVNLIEVDADHKKFHFFWDRASEIVSEFVEKCDFFLFIEQDVVLTKKPNVNQEIPIQINLHSAYLSIFDSAKNMVYPRIWEGCTFVRSDIVRDALKSSVRLGSQKNIPEWILDGCSEYWTTNSALHLDFVDMHTHISRSSFLDTMSEFGMYCFKRQIPYELKSNDLNYEYGDQVVHFRGCDMIVRDNPTIYESPTEMHKMTKCSKVWQRLCNGCAFLFLMSGIYERDKVVAKMIANKFKKSDKFLSLKLGMMSENCAEWMSHKEIEDLNWAKLVLKNPILFA